MEQQIVKVPEHEVVVALGGPQAIGVRSVELEKDLAVNQEAEQLHTGKAVPPP